MLSIVIKSNVIYKVRVLRREEKARFFFNLRETTNARKRKKRKRKTGKGPGREEILRVNTYISSPLRGLECDHNDQELEGGDVSVDCEQ